MSQSNARFQKRVCKRRGHDPGEPLDGKVFCARCGAFVGMALPDMGDVFDVVSAIDIPGMVDAGGPMDLGSLIGGMIPPDMKEIAR